MIEQGLAQQQAMQGQPQGGEQQISEDMIRQVAELLAQGMTPEELLERGVPKEVIEMAMQVISSQATDVPIEQAGLAGMHTQQGM